MRRHDTIRALRQPAVWLVALGCCTASANELPLSAVPVATETVAIEPAVETPRSRLAPPISSWAARASTELRPARSSVVSSVSIVELPPEGLPGVSGQRRHHALSIRSDMPQRMLRSIGVEATECSTRFRMPSKLKQEAGGTLSFNVQAQVGLACRF